jgi:acetyl-CoA carboxylase biotin carboxyl carrier protein
MTQFDIDAETIRKLAELMTETDLSEIEMAQGDRSLRVSRASRTKHVEIAAPQAAPTAAVPPPSVQPAANPASHPGAVISPMVGTAYLQGEPGSPPFASVGDTVRTGDTLLIIEAMKVMNPIKSPRNGTVMQVLISDGQPVEYGEPLMIIE